MTDEQGLAAAHGNRDYPWDEFSPDDYFKYNYANMRDDDRQIVETVRDFFVKTFQDVPPSGLRGIDVGTGSNLYPALTMLPFCESITLCEFSAANVEWLERQSIEEWPSWDEAWANFWLVLSKKPQYERFPDPKTELARRVRIVQGDVLSLEADRRWDVGTMFFVAESITGQHEEFIEALDHFFGLLKPNSPFAMAFMEHSKGYKVGQQPFPATDIDRLEVKDCLNERATGVETFHLGPGDKPLREAYTGMIVAHGRVK